MDDNIQTFNFDTLSGNLLNRSYNIPGMDTLSESFGYDDFSLTRTTVSGQPADTISYDLAGNISYKSGIGDYRYVINRLDSILAASTTIPLTDQSLTYTAENLTESITQNDGRQMNFLYGPGNQRIRSVLTNEGDTIKTKYYSGSYEKVITDSCTREYNYINSPVGPVAVIIKEGETETVYYLETDHLGSIIGLLRSDGSYAEKYSYDPWGRRRNPADWSYDSIPAPALIDRGFTGHEHLDEFGLINMNGRMYDPYIGRFLSVDPIIQFPDNVLSFNGYGYCLNNPLSKIDPSGLESIQIAPENFGKFLAQFSAGVNLSLLTDIYKKQNNEDTQDDPFWVPLTFGGSTSISFCVLNDGTELFKINGIIISKNALNIINGVDKGGSQLWLKKMVTSKEWANMTFGTSIITSITSTAASQTVIDLTNAKYLIRGQNLKLQATTFNNVYLDINRASGVMGVVTNGMELANDFNTGNENRGWLNATQGFIYGIGTGCLLFPGAQGVGVLLISIAGISDGVQALIEGR